MGYSFLGFLILIFIFSGSLVDIGISFAGETWEQETITRTQSENNTTQ